MATLVDNERAFLISALGLTDTVGAAMSLADLQNSYYASGGVVGRVLGSAQLRHATVDTTISTVSTVAADVDAANLSVAFVAPASGKVKVRLSAYGTTNANTYSHIWSLRDSGGNNIANSSQSLMNSIQGMLSQAVIPISGLTPGVTYTWRWAWRVSAAGTANLFHGPTYGLLTMEVAAA